MIAPHLPWYPVPHCEWGSRRVDGRYFDVVEIRGPVFGPTYYSQLFATQLGATCYAEAHLNASTDPKAQRAEAIVSLTAQPRARAWASAYLDELVTQGVQKRVGPVVTGRGSGNIARVRAPAMLLEPGFISDPEFAAFARTGEGIDALGAAFANATIRTFPAGGLVAIRVGHAYRKRPGHVDDPGAPVADPDDSAEDPEWDSEVELCEAYLGSAVERLITYDPRKVA